MPQQLRITDAEIDEIGRVLRYDFRDEQRRAVLRATRTCDILACPGSGKTTLLVAKVAILAGKWVWPDRGICVLSHTNAARLEVERRLTGHAAAANLFLYPHFIGTIQAFVDALLALPQLRDNGSDIQAVDNDRFHQAAQVLTGQRKYEASRRYFQARGGIEDIAGSLTYAGPELEVQCPGRKLPSATTRTRTQLHQLKEELRAHGYFRFEDMFAFARRRLASCPDLVDALRIRFPWVFIDEMQDTSELQDSFLQAVFGDGVILERFGDANQAIFGTVGPGAGQSSFPHDADGSALTVSKSKRFGPHIARFATRLAVARPETLAGRCDRPPRRHTIFTFDSDSIANVLPWFGNLLLEEFDDAALRDRDFKAVGAIRRTPELRDAARLPQCIGDYWAEFDPVISRTACHPQHFVDYVRMARQLLEQRGECAEPYAMLSSAFLSLLHRHEARAADGARFSRAGLRETLYASGTLAEFDELLRDLCLSGDEVDEARWGHYTKQIAAALRTIVQLPGSVDAAQFMNWRAPAPPQGAGTARGLARRDNVFRHQQFGRTVSIEVTTIHSVKGQTHAATLVLETFWQRNGYDIGDALGWIFDGNQKTPRNRNSGPHRTERLKRLYVAVTRPTDLLCLAVHRNRFPQPVRDALTCEGWAVTDL